MGAHAWDGSPYQHYSITRGDREPCPGGDRCLKRVLPRFCQEGRRRGLPRRQLPPKEHLRGAVAPIGRGPPTGGAGSLAQEAVAG